MRNASEIGLIIFFYTFTFYKTKLNSVKNTLKHIYDPCQNSLRSRHSILYIRLNKLIVIFVRPDVRITI